ncbi:MAG: HAMP domain-containing sensor histidine kinase [Pseudomonadota bacterium]
MIENGKIDWFRARFVSDETEGQFRDYAFNRYVTSNIVGLSIALTLTSVYIVFDIFETVNPQQVVGLKLGVVAFGAACIAAMRSARFKRHFDMLTMLVVMAMATMFNVFIWWQPTIENTYYMGLIQGLILFSLLLRLEMTSWLYVVGVTMTGFVIAAFSKGDAPAAMLQSTNVFLVSVICVAGVNLLQRYQRIDFLKNRTIEKQNIQLTKMLEDVQLDNERKIAALGMMVHFVRTPIHQISGFTDVVLSQLNSLGRQDDAQDCIENAKFIKAASSELVSNVTRLLEYHRLDELERGLVFEPVNIAGLVTDASDAVADYEKVALTLAEGKIVSASSLLEVALRSLVSNINDHAAEASAITIDVTLGNEGATIRFGDDGPGLDEATFKELSKPLTEIRNHLNTTGASMPMGLRTAARAIEICGGVLTYQQGVDGAFNTFTIELPDMSASTKLANAAAHNDADATDADANDAAVEPSDADRANSKSTAA